jgi:hypothetical protein
MRVVRHPEVLWRRTLDRTVVLGPHSNDPKVLEPPGDAIWELLEDPIELDGLVDRLATDFGADDARVRADLSVFLDDLLRAGVVVEVGPDRSVS